MEPLKNDLSLDQESRDGVNAMTSRTCNHELESD